MAWQFTGESVEWVDDANPKLADFLQNGGLNFADPALQKALRQFQHLGNEGDPFSDPAAMAWALRSLGVQPDQLTSVLQGSTGLDPNYLNSVYSSYGALDSRLQEASQEGRGGILAGLSKGIGSVMDPAAEIFDQYGVPITAAALLSGAGAFSGAGASAGGTAAATEGTALGSGLTPGAGGVTGLTPGTTAGGIGGGAVGTGITTAIPATSPFALSALAPTIGAGSFFPGIDGVYGASGGGTAAGTAAGGGALSRLLDGSATADDWLDLLGRAAPAALGAFASNQQANSLSDLAERYMGFGEPSRARFEGSFAPGFSMANEPGYADALNQTAKATLHGMSANFGNPSDSPNAWAQTLEDLNAKFAYPALQNYRQVNANTGGLASFAPAAVNASGSAVNAERGIYDSVGGGIADVFHPPKSLADIMREIRRAGF
ncbi:MAG: hypothetical protein Q8P46_17825 [Hyphomicrobiales bacterium]|nr:hypothetical protein [Hyphomicrobiales bacterium]